MSNLMCRDLTLTVNVLNSGYLMKKGEERRSWKKRWFVLTSSKIYIYKNAKANQESRIIDLTDIQKIVKLERNYEPVMALITPMRTLYVRSTEYDEAIEEWSDKISRAKEYGKKIVYRVRNPTPYIDRKDKRKILYQGYLWQLNGNKWKKRFFTLTADYLLYYKDETKSSPPTAFIKLQEMIALVKIGEFKGRHYCFKIVIAGEDLILSAWNLDSWLYLLRVARKSIEQENLLSLSMKDFDSTWLDTC